MLVTALSLLGCLVFLRVYLVQTARQSVDDFSKQNLDAFVTGDAYQLATRLSSMSSSAHWVCVSAELSGQEFFSRSIADDCTEGPFRTALTLVPPANPRLSVRFTIALPDSLRFAGMLFSALQLALLGSLFWGGRATARREERLRLRNELELAELAAQVAHDIRSPLAALDGFVGRSAGIPAEERTLVRAIATRIAGIADTLLERHRAALERTSGSGGAAGPDGAIRAPRLLGPIVQAIVAERLARQPEGTPRIELRAPAGPNDLFAAVEPVALGRLVSNLLNNALEAQARRPGSVTVSVEDEGDFVRIAIRDEGGGIPAALLGSLGRRGATFGKEGGSGLGLYHARTRCEAWGGRLAIDSREGEGTTVSAVLPKAPAPGGFVRELVVLAGARVLVLDDDPSIHLTWRERLGSMVEGFATASALREAFGRMPEEARGSALFLVDFDLGAAHGSGLDLIEELGIGPRSILVTSRFEDPILQERCIRARARLLPKAWAGSVPIARSPASGSGVEPGGARVAEPGGARVEARVDAVLVDDDVLVRLSWQHAARAAGKKLICFASPEGVLREVASLPRSTPVYADQDLGQGRRGVDLLQALRDLGFSALHLATGYSAEQLRPPPWIQGVVGKDPPWQAAPV